MASQHQSRIQFYLEKNRIGPLFEEMMTKLIAEMPDHPIPFLISHLQTKHSCSGKLYRTLSGSAALWAEPGSAESKGIRRDFRSNEKPWQIHPKKPKKSKSDLAVSNISPPSPDSKSLPRSIEHPSCDWGGCPESRDFDELNHILQESRKLGKALENLSRSKSSAFLLPCGCLVRPRVVGQWAGREDEDADPLAAEMLQPPVPRTKTEGWQGEDSGPVGSLKVEPKSKGLKQQQQHHKKLLAAMLSQDSFESAPDSPAYIAEDDIEDEDEAMELLEDLDDLRMEGVTGLAPSGGRFSQGRGSSGSEPQAKVTLNICSRCARLQGDSLIARDGDGTGGLRVRFVSPAVRKNKCAIYGVFSSNVTHFSSHLNQRLPVWDSDLKSVKGRSSLTQKGLQLKDSLFAKELQSMEKHLSVAEKDLAKLSAGRLLRAPGEPHEAILLPHNAGPRSPLLGATPSPLTAGDPHSGGGARAQTPSCLPTPSSLVPWASLSGREEALVGHAGRPQLTPPGPSTTDALGKSAEEICHQLQAVRQPWLVPSDAESDHVESLPKDSRECTSLYKLCDSSDTLLTSSSHVPHRLLTGSSETLQL
uniref:Chromosome 8 open reading frame 34 n=1 Tax=Paramormyrops kingsleyae TaxID=1676925 RepID=A0A3B3RZZ5_9TELE